MVIQMIFALNLKSKGRVKYSIGNSDILHPKIVTTPLDYAHSQLEPTMIFLG